MADWQEELAMLLRELGVRQEEPETLLRSTHISENGFQSLGNLTDLQAMFGMKRQEQMTDAIQWADMREDDDVWMSDLSLMRREVESIVTQVMRLMQRGGLDTSLKEDVMVVLQALRRRATVTQQAAASDTAYLEFAAAMLHFCRLVLRLSEVSTEDL